MRLLLLVALAAGAALRLPDEMEVDVGCELHVGDAINGTHRVLRVTTPGHGNFENDGSASDLEFKDLLTRQAFLCHIDTGHQRDDRDKVALVSLATSLDYLVGKMKKKHGHRMDILGALSAKAAYVRPVWKSTSRHRAAAVTRGDNVASMASIGRPKFDSTQARQHGLSYYTWLGVIPTYAPEEDCRDPTHSTGHVYKALAMVALLEYKDIDWVVFIDMDTLPSLTSLAPHDYIKLSDSANLIGGSNPSLPILLNSGLLFIRNTHWSRSFLKRWWALRCGFKDQLSLWKALFEAWGKETDFEYPDHALASYASARHYALPLVINQLSSLLEPGTRWDLSTERDALVKTGCLLEPLRLRHLLLLPVVPFDDKEFGKVPPSISRDGAGPWNDEYWICHAACVFDTPKKPKKISEDQCRNESTFHVYNCQCGDLYNARQRLRVGGV